MIYTHIRPLLIVGLTPALGMTVGKVSIDWTSLLDTFTVKVSVGFYGLRGRFL